MTERQHLPRTRLGPLGYGAKPHGSEAQRVEGYPSAPTAPQENPESWVKTGPQGQPDASAQDGPQSQPNAYYRLKKQDVAAKPPPPFLDSTEKSSIESTSYEDIHRIKQLSKLPRLTIFLLAAVPE